MNAVPLAASAAGVVVALPSRSRSAVRTRLRSVRQRDSAGSPGIGLLAAVCAPALAGWSAGAVAAIACAVVVAVARHAHGVFDRRRDTARVRRAGVESIGAVAAELRAGRPLPVVLAVVATDAGPLRIEFDRAAQTAASGGDVAGVLRSSSRRPGADALRSLAACWAVSADSGAALADALDRVAAGLAAA